VGMLNLREQWTLPVFWFQVLALHRVISLHPALVKESTWWRIWLWALRGFTTICLIFWQFSAFVFLLQVSAVFLCTLLLCTQESRTVLVTVVSSHLLAAAVAAALLLGNQLLVDHMLVTQCVAILLAVRLLDVPSSWWWCWRDGALAVGIFSVLRCVQSLWATADEHVGELARDKLHQLFPSLLVAKEPSFNSRLYLAVSVFNFIDKKAIEHFVATGVLPLAAVGAFLSLASFLRVVSGIWLSADRNGSSKRIDATGLVSGVFLVQLILLVLLGCFIDRLKVLGGPLLCVLAASTAGPCLVKHVFNLTPTSFVGRFMVLAAVLVQFGQLYLLGSHVPQLQDQLTRLHRDMVWPDGETGELHHWLGRRLPANATVLTSMSLSGELRLHTPFRVINHPQFEDRSLRDRVQEIYAFYQCTPPETVADIMRKYTATHLILEYKRCDFSPFMLDNHPELNCKASERSWSDLFCPRAHASPDFDMLFANAGYVVFKLVEPGQKPALAAKATDIHDFRAWKQMLKRCMKEDPQECGARIAEIGTMFYSKLKQPAVADMLFEWVRKKADTDGAAVYQLGRHVDYTLENPREAGSLYQRAYELLPNNPTVVREYLLWLDMEGKDYRALEKLLRTRRHTRGDLLSILDMNDAELACEASVPAWELLGDLYWSEDLFKYATVEGAGSSCVETNWALLRQKDMKLDLGLSGQFLNVFWRRGMRSRLTSFVAGSARWNPLVRSWDNLGLMNLFDAS